MAVILMECSHRYWCRVGGYHRRGQGNAIEVDAKASGQRSVCGKDREHILRTCRSRNESLRRLNHANKDDEWSKDS
jgi:hypothetical protein